MCQPLAIIFCGNFYLTTFVNVCQRHPIDITTWVCGYYMISTLTIPKYVYLIFRKVDFQKEMETVYDLHSYFQGVIVLYVAIEFVP